MRTQKPPRLTYARPSPEVIRGNRWHGQMGRPIARLLGGVRGGHTLKGGKKKRPLPRPVFGRRRGRSYMRTPLPHLSCGNGALSSAREMREWGPHLTCGKAPPFSACEMRTPLSHLTCGSGALFSASLPFSGVSIGLVKKKLWIFPRTMHGGACAMDRAGVSIRLVKKNGSSRAWHMVDAMRSQKVT